MSVANNNYYNNYANKVMLCPFRIIIAIYVPTDSPNDYAVPVYFRKGERNNSISYRIVDDFECEATKKQSFVISMNTDALRVEVSPQVNTTEVFIDDTNETECGTYVIIVVMRLFK